MLSMKQTTDGTGRVRLPQTFANTTVVIDQVSATELRIRKAGDGQQETVFVEETISPLSDRDRDLFLALLENPPPANEVLSAAIKKSRKSDA